MLLFILYLHLQSNIEKLYNKLCCLEGAPRLNILFSNYEHTHIKRFADIDLAESKIDKRSTTGYVFLLVRT